MNYTIVRTDSYFKKLKRFLKKNPDMIERYIKTIEMLELNPHHPSLRIHKLKGKLSDVYCISINMEYRVIIDFIIRDGEIIPVDISSHDGVY